jgi:hypothetical protein
MKKLSLLAAAIFAALTYFSGQYSTTSNQSLPAISGQGAGNAADAIIADAFANHKSDLQVTGEGLVAKVLPDDKNGSKHQKFLLKLSTGQTLLVAHNIDLAPRVDSLRAGEPIQFSGEYEWSAKGGVLHWTHRDPRGSHVAGWLKYRGQTYQ